MKKALASEILVKVKEGRYEITQVFPEVEMTVDIGRKVVEFVIDRTDIRKFKEELATFGIKLEELDRDECT